MASPGPNGGGGGSSSGAAAAVRPAASQLPPPIHDLATQAAVTTAQMLVVLTQWAGARGDLAMRVQPVFVLALFALALPIMLHCPKFYQRQRSWLLPLLRVAPLLPPSARSVGVGTAVILERAVQPGLKGTVVGILRAATGIRILPQAVQSIFQAPLPPLAAVVTHAAITALTFNSRGYCDSALLSDGLLRTLQARLAAVLDYAAMALTGSSLLPADMVHGNASEQVVCLVVMTFVHVGLGFLLPTLLAVYSYQPHQHPRQHEHDGGSPANAAALRQLVGRIDRGIYTMLCGRAGLALRTLLCCYVVCLAWLLSKICVGAVIIHFSVHRAWPSAT